MSKYLKLILEEMCQRVGADFEKIDFKKPTWFQDYVWTQEVENDFKEWLTKFLEKNKEARTELVAFPFLKNSVEKFSDEFITMYGWKIK